MTEQEYLELFIELYNNGEPIINNTTKEVFEAQIGEEFRQCWADTIERRLFPKYWFVSQIGNLLSAKKDKIQWIHKNKRENSNKISYKFLADKGDGQGAKLHNVEEHDLVALVWGAETFGRAEELVKEKGLEAFGINSKTELNIQGHHKNRNDKDNSVENIKLVTNQVHVAIENAPSFAAPEEKHVEYMQEIGELMAVENPTSISVIFTGEVYDKTTGEWSDDGDIDVFATKKITLSPTAYMQIKSLIEMMNQV